jgi:hypothetical protein
MKAYQDFPDFFAGAAPHAKAPSLAAGADGAQMGSLDVIQD